MSTRVDVEEIQTTKSEKLLAAVLAIFVLIGGVWTYVKIDDYVADAIEIDYRGTGENRAALARQERALARLNTATGDQSRARDNLELTREAYRTALDEGRAAPALRRDYVRAQTHFAETTRELSAAKEAVSAAQPAADDANESQRS